MLQNRILVIRISCLFFLGLFGCDRDCHYTIKADHIKSTCGFTGGFVFNELRVHTFEDGVPDSVEVVRKIDFGLIKEDLKPSKKVYFYKENKNYDWFDFKNMESKSTLPIKMEIGEWYQIRGLTFRGHPDRAAYIKLKENGELEVHGYSESTFY